MYKEKTIHYKMVYGLDDESDVIEYHTNCIVYEGEKTRINFKGDDYIIDIEYDDHEVTLKHGESVLRLDRDHIIENEYVLPIGVATIYTEVIKYEMSDQFIDIHYTLSNDQGIMSTNRLAMLIVPIVEYTQSTHE